VVYIGGIGVLLEVLSRWHNEIYDFLISNFFHFPQVIWPKKFQILNGNFHSKFLKLKFSISSFEISKTKIFKFFHFNFLWHISKFSFNFDGMAKIFQMSVHISKSNFLVQFSHFPLVVWQKFSNFKNKNFQFKFQKQKKSIFYFKFSLWHQRFFSQP
jgi:hypothetical protein